MLDRLKETDVAQQRRMRRRFRKGVFVVPSLLTTANIFCGFYSVMESLAGVEALSGNNILGATEHFDRAAINIAFSWLFDNLDGRIARMAGATSEFGIELDSIADVLSFGLAPALLAYAWGYGQIEGLHKLAWAVSFLFIICGALRLARFNVQARQTKPDLPPKNPKVDKKAFVGMPIPAAGGLVAAIVHFAPTPIAHVSSLQFSAFGRSLAVGGKAYAVGLIVLVACLAFLMVSTIRHSTFKWLSSRSQQPRMVILLLALVVVGIWFYSQWLMLIFATAYASHGVLAKLWSMVKPRRGVADHAELELDRKPQ
jgi:CDP-diacylglycerol--serine O-phosphatidyltransferase